MTSRDKYHALTSWKKRARATALFHTIKQMRDPKWTQADTARALGISTGMVSENLLIASHLKELTDIDKRSGALRIVRSL